MHTHKPAKNKLSTLLKDGIITAKQMKQAMEDIGYLYEVPCELSEFRYVWAALKKKWTEVLCKFIAPHYSTKFFLTGRSWATNLCPVV